MHTTLCSIVLCVLVASAPIIVPGQPRSEIRVWTARALGTVLAEIGPEYERRTGYKLHVTSDLASGFARRLIAGEPVDLLISGSPAMDEWIADGRILAGTRADIARSGIGVEVRQGAAKPDISSVEAFKRTLLAAKSIAYLRIGSGIHMDKVIARLGIAEAIQAKVVRPQSDIVSELVARGEVELGIVVITQILTTPGVTFVGPLPADLQSHVLFSAGIPAISKTPDAARQLIQFLTGPTAQPVIRRQGMEPVF
jgi:molybdate transport system substrate-binding protein